MVRLERGNRRGTAELGYVSSGDSFETAAGGGIRFRFPAGRIVEAGPETKLTLREEKSGAVVQVARGSVRVGFSGAADGGREPAEFAPPLTLRTENGWARCEGIQDSAAVQVGSDAAEVQVLGGKVEVASRTGKSLYGGRGDRFILSAGKFERAVEPAAPAIAAANGRTAIRVLIPAGVAEVRRSDSRKWVRISPRGDSVSEGDLLRVRAGELAMDLAGAQLIAVAGAELLYERGGDEPSFALSKGEVALKLDQPKRRSLSISGIHLASQDAGHFLLARTPQGFELTALAGDIAFQKSSFQGQALAGQLATFQGSRPPLVEDLDRAELVLTSMFGITVYQAGMDWVTFAWDGTKAEGRVEVASDAAFSNMLLRGAVHRPFVNVPAPGQGSLFWRALDAEGKTLGRGGVLFGPELPSGDLARPRSVPEGNELGMISKKGVPALLIRAPRNGEPVKSKVEASGIAPAGARVLVNGKLAPLDDKLRFDLSVAPVGQPPMIIFRLVRPSEPDLIVVRSLTPDR